jgi:heparin binding hemagglutinin HbhA
MAVSLPTAADVRKVREQAAQNVAEQAEVARTPLLAVLGAGDYAVATVSKAVADARTRAAERREFVAELPQKLTTDELRKLVADLRAQAESTYEGFAERGEKAWGKIRKQPQVKQAIATIESYTEKLDARVDVLVDDAHDAAEKALSTVTRQTRSTGEKVARGTQKFAADAAETVAKLSDEVSQTVAAKGSEASKTVAAKGADAAEAITEAGDEAAHETRSVARKAANRTAPKVAPKAAARKPATRRTTVNGSSDS